MEHHHINFLPKVESEKAIAPPPKRSWLFLFILAGIILFTIIGIGFTVGRDTSPSEPEAYDPITLEPKQPSGLLRRISNFVFSKDITLFGEKNDRINFLLMGMGGEGHDGPYLTDTIILASLKPSTGQVAMVSIPRDLGIDIPGYGWRKINHANAFGEKNHPGQGAVFATEIMEKLFDIDIHYFVRVDFAAFEQIIDDVGGIAINVERSFTDTQYPAPNYLFQTISFTKGTISMNGKTALIYARSRHGNNGEGSDFARARRQQKMLLALKEKILSFSTLSNPVRIHNIYSTLANHISTNMEFADIITLMKLAKNIHFNEIKTEVLDSSPNGFLVNGQTTDGAFILTPVAGSFKEINTMIATIFSEEWAGTRSMVTSTPVQETPPIPAAIIEIQNGTWRAGLAARVGKALQQKQISATTVSNALIRPQLESGIYKIKATAPADVLTLTQSELNLPIKQNLPEGITPKEDTEILILLGEDYQE